MPHANVQRRLGICKQEGLKMITLRDSIEIEATPQKILDWLVRFEENYKAWHPDHVECYWLKGKPAEEGSILYVEEYIHGSLHKMRMRITRIEPAKTIEYKILLPMSIICPEGSFIIEPKGESCIFTATLSFRFGEMLSKLAKDRVEALKEHMKEEGESLKRLLEMS
jgi:hypothetical protein